MWQHHEGVDCFLNNSGVTGSVVLAAVLLVPELWRRLLSLAFAFIRDSLSDT